MPFALDEENLSVKQNPVKSKSILFEMMSTILSVLRTCGEAPLHTGQLAFLPTAFSEMVSVPSKGI